MTIDSDDKILDFPIKAKPVPVGDSPLTIVGNFGGCQHNRTLVDARLAEVTCADCKERLNPMLVLKQIAHEDSRLHQRWLRLRAEIEVLKATMEARTRCKCDYCGRMTKIKYDLPMMAVHNIQQQLEAEDRANAKQTP